MRLRKNSMEIFWNSAAVVLQHSKGSYHLSWGHLVGGIWKLGIDWLVGGLRWGRWCWDLYGFVASNDNWDNDIFANQKVLVSRSASRLALVGLGWIQGILLVDPGWCLGMLVLLTLRPCFAVMHGKGLMVKLGNFCNEYRIGMRIIHSDLWFWIFKSRCCHFQITWAHNCFVSLFLVESFVDRESNTVFFSQITSGHRLQPQVINFSSWLGCLMVGGPKYFGKGWKLIWTLAAVVTKTCQQIGRISNLGGFCLEGMGHVVMQSNRWLSVSLFSQSDVQAWKSALPGTNIAPRK